MIIKISPISEFEGAMGQSLPPVTRSGYSKSRKEKASNNLYLYSYSLEVKVNNRTRNFDFFAFVIHTVEAKIIPLNN
jgi:hypothetical protein